jgi:predicted DNA-binding transcriptional regulator AlpA
MTPRWAMRGRSPYDCRFNLDPIEPSAAPAPVQPTQEALDHCLDKRGLGRFLGVSVRTLDRAIAAGLLPRPDLTVGRSPRWAPETISRFLKSRPRLPGRGGCRHGH